MADPAGWLAALDAQLELIKWWDSEKSQDNSFTLAPFISKEIERDCARLADRPLTDPEARAHAELLQEMATTIKRTQLDSIRRAATYWVSSEMTRFLSFAQQDFPDTPLAWAEVSETSGYIYFDEPVEFTGDVDGVPATKWFRSLHWTSLGYGDDPEDFAVLGELRVPGRLEPEANTLMPGRFYTDDTMQRMLRAFWALIRQRIAVPTRKPVGRPGRRRAARVEFHLPEDGAINVVDLRRPERKRTPAAVGEQLVEWSHRWIVSGHWRNQWYPSEEMHRPKFIEAYEKGPESAPLLLKDRVYRVVR